MKKLAICIPTYQQSEYINFFLDNELEAYKDSNIDVYIMDSSYDDSTYLIYQEYMQRGFPNIYYKRFPSDMHSNVKVYKIFQMAGKEIKCDYIWIRSDALKCSNELIEILPCILKNDIIITSYEGKEPRDIWETKDLNLIFQKYTWKLCLYGAVILNVETMINGADWKYLEKKYLVDDKINFSHVCFYFEQALQIKDFNALIMDLPMQFYYGNGLKTRSGWHKDMFHIWLDVWPTAISALPDFYQNKMNVIRSFGKNTVYYRLWYLIMLREEKVLTRRIYTDYCNKFIKYSGVSPLLLKKALLCENTNFSYEIKDRTALLKFARKYNKIYIYGCGKRAKRYYKYLKKAHINNVAFVVSTEEEAVKRKEVMKGTEVYSIGAIKFKAGEGLALGVNPINQNQIIPLIIDKIDEDDIFLYPLDGIAKYMEYFSFKKKLSCLV